jgi:hypothetical protein
MLGYKIYYTKVPQISQISQKKMNNKTSVSICAICGFNNKALITFHKSQRKEW